MMERGYQDRLACSWLEPIDDDDDDDASLLKDGKGSMMVFSYS